MLFNIIELDLIYTSLTEAFEQYIYFSLILSLIFSIPILMFHSIIFLTPGLYVFELKVLLYNLLKYTILFTLFYSTCFSDLFKLIVSFFVQFESSYLTLNLKIADLLSFLNSFILSFLLIFILPFISIDLKNKRKYIYIVLLIIISLITPPDLLSLILSVIPLMVLFELNYLLWVITDKYSNSGHSRVLRKKG